MTDLFFYLKIEPVHQSLFFYFSFNGYLAAQARNPLRKSIRLSHPIKSTQSMALQSCCLLREQNTGEFFNTNWQLSFNKG